MKSIILAATVLALSAGVATAAPGHKHRHGGYVTKHRTVGHLSLFERFKISRSRARLAMLKRHIRFDGYVTRRERMRLRIAQKRHHALVRRARWN